MKSDVPIPKQALVLSRALEFDTKLPGRAGSKLVLASLFNDDATKKRALRMNVEFSHTGMQVHGLTLSTIALEFTTPEGLADAILAQGIDVVYVPSGMGTQVSQIAKIAREAHVITIGAEPTYITSGLSLGVFDKDGTAVLALNQGAASAAGAAFGGEILKVAVPLN